MPLNIQQASDHVEELIKQYRIGVQFTPNPIDGAGYLTSRKIVIAPITDDISYYVALHEIGHVICQHCRARVYVTVPGAKNAMEYHDELEARDWAYANAIEVTPEMERFADYCIEGYRKKWEYLQARVGYR